ncbi:MAG: hypothetical protein Q8Q15_02450 [bacterium]|nr:hypothetical protein [bacterium]
MTDDKTKKVEEVTPDETTPTEEPKTEKPVVDEAATTEPTEAPIAEEPVEEPASAPAASTGGATAVGTDQQGRQLYEVKCSDCGKLTQVPFNPTGDRPVYCRDCYMKRKG